MSIAERTNQIENIDIGCLLTPIELWNQTERPSKHLSNPTKVLGIRTHVSSQSKKLVKVAMKNGAIDWLDVGWFELNNI